ncbi:MAG TPA: TetR/AcrR family transcriptional regulator [Polyangiaceae bacterium]
MGTQERRERERQEFRTKILEAASQLLTTEGYDAVTMRMIAQKIEYSVAALYQHFENKETIFGELSRQVFRQMGSQFNAVLAGIEDPIERLRAAASLYIGFAVQCPQYFRLVLMTRLPRVAPTTPHNGEKDDPELIFFIPFRAAVEDAIRADLLRPELSDDELIAQALWGAIHGLATLEVQAAFLSVWIDFRDLDVRRDFLVATLLRGIQRQPDS